MALFAFGALLSGAFAAEAGGLNCDRARAHMRAGQNISQSQQLMRDLSDIHGFGLLSQWAIDVFGGPRDDNQTAPLQNAGADWSGSWRTYPIDPATQKPQEDAFGGFEIEQGVAGPWLRWRIDASDPCEGRTYLPLISGKAAVLRVDVDRVRFAVIDGLAFDGPEYSPKQRETLAEIWGDAEPILHSITLSRSGDICRLSYEVPDGPVHLAFYCKTGSGE